MDDVTPGALVVLDCSNPREKLWGILVRLDAVGAVVRGLDINSVDDWLRQEMAGRPRLIEPSTVFIPTHRVNRIYLDHGSVGMSSYADRYADACGGDVRDALLGHEEVQ